MKEKTIEPGKILVDETISSRLVPRTELEQDLIENRPELVQTNASVSRRYPFFQEAEEERAYEEIHRLFHASKAKGTYELCEIWLKRRPYNMLFREHQVLAMSILPTTDAGGRLEACISHAKETLAMNGELRAGTVPPELVPSFVGGLSEENHDHIDGVMNYNLAEWCNDLGRPEEAARHAEAAVRCLPDPVSRTFAYALLIAILGRQGRTEEAARIEREARTADAALFEEVQRRVSKTSI